MTRYRPTVFVVLAILFGVSCTGGDSAAPTTTQVLATSSSTTTSSTTTTTTSTTTTTTTEPESEYTALEQEVIDAYLRAEDVWTECVYDVPKCDEGLLAEGLSGNQFDRSLRNLVSLKEEGLEVRPPKDANNLSFTVESVVVESGGQAASVTSCAVDGRRVVEPKAGVDGKDLLVNGNVSSSRIANSLLLASNGEWLLDDGEVLEKYEGGSGCQR